MAIHASVLDALVSAGATAEMIVAAVKAAEATDEAAKERRRAGNAERQRRKRAKDAAAVSRVTERDDALQHVTPFNGSPPNPPSLKTLSPSPKGDSPYSEIIVEWSEMAHRVRLPKIVRLTNDRRKKLRALCDRFGREAISCAISAVGSSPFCRGEGSKGWRADFSFVLKEENIVRLIEGAFSSPDRAQLVQKSTREPSTIADLRRALECAAAHDWLQQPRYKRYQARLNELEQTQFGNDRRRDPGAVATAPADAVL